MLIPLIFVLIFYLFWLCYQFCCKKHNERIGEANNGSQLDQEQIQEQREGQGVNSMESLSAERENPQLFIKQAPQITTMKAMNNILTGWNRAYSFKTSKNTSSCCVCLVEFKKDEEVIELH